MEQVFYMRNVMSGVMKKEPRANYKTRYPRYCAHVFVPILRVPILGVGVMFCVAV